MDILVFIGILWVVFSNLNKKKQKNGKGKAVAKGKQTAKVKQTSVWDQLEDILEDAGDSLQAAFAAKKEEAKPEPTPATVPETRKDWQPITSRLQDPITVSAETEETYQGSMNIHTHEGHDVEHRFPVTNPSAMVKEDYPLGEEAPFALSGQDLMRAVVMSEILGKPKSRRMGMR